MRWLLTWWRRRLVRHDLYREQPDRHPALVAMQLNELIPIKGTHWRVASIRELPTPCIILTPAGETRASKVARLRALRRADRILTKQEHQAQAAAPGRALGGRRRAS